jgi:hypothetical protein
MDGANYTTLRPMIEVDFHEAILLAMQKYNEYYPRMSYHGAWEFCEMAASNPDYLLLRGSDVYFCAGSIRSFMEPEVTVGGIWLFTRKTNLREVLAAFDAMEAWARRIGAVECGWGNISDEDLSPLAKKRGYKHASQYFSKKLIGGIQ